MMNRSRGFATTRWTLVMTAGREAAPGWREALEQLCGLYWSPLYTYARRRGYGVEQAQDLTQAFFTRFLEKHDVQDADRGRGRFRSFLLTAFKHFIANEYDREHARKRGGGQVLIPLQTDDAEARYIAEPVDDLTPEALFERQWALAVMDRAMLGLREDLLKSGKETMFELLKGLLMGEKDEGGYSGIAQALGMSEGALKVTVHRLRRKFRDRVRAEIAATVSDDAEIEEELRYLIAILTG
jgi:RNA polymerase sigma factor (sigma-70 family)